MLTIKPLMQFLKLELNSYAYNVYLFYIRVNQNRNRRQTDQGNQVYEQWVNSNDYFYAKLRYMMNSCFILLYKNKTKYSFLFVVEFFF
jgi:hypothetical protein